MTHVSQTPHEQRGRMDRVAPRRHAAPSQVSVTYDGTDFPVLLRLPDIAKLDMAQDATATTVDLPKATPASNKPKTSTARFDDAHTPADETTVPSRNHAPPQANQRPNTGPRQSHPATPRDSNLFWDTVITRVAAVGMLVGLVAVGYVLIVNPGRAVDINDSQLSDWQQPQSDQTDNRLANVANSRPGELNSMDQGNQFTAKPTLPPLVVPTTDDPQKPDTNTKPSISPPTTKPPVDSFPPLPAMKSNLAPTINSPNAPVTGWPTETPGAGSQPQLPAALELNSPRAPVDSFPVESARVPSIPPLQSQWNR